MKHLLLLISLTTIFASCGQVSSEDIDQDIIKTNYLLNYDAQTTQLEASGRFTIGGISPTYVVLDGNSNLKINGLTATFDINLFGQVSYVYKKNTTHSTALNYQFKYTNSDEDIFINNITLPSAVSLSAPTSIESDENLLINWNVTEASDLADSMIIYLSHDNGSMTKSLDEGLTTGLQEFTVEELLLLRGQTISVKICRSKNNSSIQHPGSGGSISSRYCSIKKQVILN